MAGQSVDFKGNILALDLGRQTGWCEGPINGPLQYGHWKLAHEGSQEDAVFGGLIKALTLRLQAFKPRVLVIEQPIDLGGLMAMAERGLTNDAALSMAYGLKGAALGVADRMGVYDTRTVSTGDLKHYWHGKRTLKREVVKPMTFEKIKKLGYEPTTQDAADAIAIHRYIAADIDPAYRVEPLGLFRSRVKS